MITFERLHGIFPNTPAATVQLFFIVTKSVQEIQTFYTELANANLLSFLID